jgi:hypothetical protein
MMQSDNHADVTGAEDDWRERFCLAWEAGIEVLCGLVGIGAGLLVLAGVVALVAAFPIPLAIMAGALMLAKALPR